MTNCQQVEEIFSRTKYRPSREDIESLAKAMGLLKERGLDRLSMRLVNSGRKVWDTFSELNLALALIAHHGPETLINYESENTGRPIDFGVVAGHVTYRLQMKRLSDLERENRQNKIMDNVKREASKIKVRKFFNCDLAEGFSEADVATLMDFISKAAEQSEDHKEYLFSDSKISKAKVSFWTPNKLGLSHLTPGSWGDMDVVNETGLAATQIKESLANAAGAFENGNTKDVINLVAMDADRHEDIDLCDAVFGTEFDQVTCDKWTWSRKKDGFFHLPDSEKVAGVIAMKRKERKPVADAQLILLVNNSHKDLLNDLKRVLPFEKIINFNERPLNGDGNF